MIRPAMFICVLAISVLAFAVYQVEYRVQEMRGQLKEINKQIASDKKAIHVLSAEWSYLNQPERLKSMADKFLKMDYVSASKIVEIEQIPMQQESVAVLNTALAE